MDGEELNLDALRKRALENTHQNVVFELWRAGCWMLQFIHEVERVRAERDELQRQVQMIQKRLDMLQQERQQEHRYGQH
jgi:tetrahydrodipicolinate N-succinyltransferase